MISWLFIARDYIGAPAAQRKRGFAGGRGSGRLQRLAPLPSPCNAFANLRRGGKGV
jgi:hypothetical protein